MLAISIATNRLSKQANRVLGEAEKVKKKKKATSTTYKKQELNNYSIDRHAWLTC